MTAPTESFTLSRQESRVVALSMEGLGDKEVAQAMGLSLGTVRTYWKRIAAKVGGSTRAEIVTLVTRRDSVQELEQERSLVAQLQREITQRREAEAQFRAICACSPVGIYVSGVDGRCTYVNPAWERITGLPFSATRGDAWGSIVHPDDIAELTAWWLDGVNRGSSSPLEFRFVTQGGTLWVRTNFSPMIVEGETVGYVGTIEDVSACPERLKRANPPQP
jgi:PAS domain S-box-containing protein